MGTLRGYITIAELENIANITVTDQTEAYDQISFAEELIDQYVGFQDKAYNGQATGTITSVDETTIVDNSSDSQINFTQGNYLQNCILQIISGPGAGESRRIVASGYCYVEVEEAFDTEPTNESVYRIYQLAKFPRRKDSIYKSSVDKYYKFIPEKVKNAVAAQIQFANEMGEEYFTGPDTDANSESIGNYSYSNGGVGSGGAQTAPVRMISPKARTLLRGIVNRTGQIVG